MLHTFHNYVAADMSRWFAEISCSLLIDLEFPQLDHPSQRLNKQVRNIWFRDIGILRVIQQHWFTLSQIVQFQNTD